MRNCNLPAIGITQQVLQSPYVSDRVLERLTSEGAFPPENLVKMRDVIIGEFIT
jgi:hypothetical protein